MHCPKCESTNIHRSRRNGSFEKDVLTPLAIYPFRCSDCRARFLRFRPEKLPKNLNALMANPPKWISALLWLAFIVVVALFLGYLVAKLRK